ncbi:hypothetical protein B0E55_06242 [Rhodococcus sp. 66b]|nr:hypothetical protein B0E55_06242 [Rhodococcus sp. 66b]
MLRVVGDGCSGIGSGAPLGPDLMKYVHDRQSRLTVASTACSYQQATGRRVRGSGVRRRMAAMEPATEVAVCVRVSVAPCARVAARVRCSRSAVCDRWWSKTFRVDDLDAVHGFYEAVVVSPGVGDSPAAGDGSRRIGRIPLARVVWDARGPLPVGACRGGPCSATRCLCSVPPSGWGARYSGW